MINKDELMHGNIVDVGIIKSFYEYGIKTVEGETYMFQKINPVPITSEKLIELGFDIINCETFHKSEFHYSIYMRDDLFYDYNLNEIKYIHELQNKFYWDTHNNLFQSLEAVKA